MSGVLKGIRVLDFDRHRRPILRGTPCRAWRRRHPNRAGGSEDRFVAPITEAQDGALFMQMNRNKRGMTLNPTVPAGQEIVRKLVATADVVVANLPPQTLQAMHLDYDSLCAVKPDIILTTVSAYGRGGPYSDRVGFDGIGHHVRIRLHDGRGERPASTAPRLPGSTPALRCTVPLAR